MRTLARYSYPFVLLGLAFVAIRCQKSVATKDVIHIHATSPVVLADGSSLDTIYADLPLETLATNRGVTFQASSGLFLNGFDTMSVMASMTNITSGKITATALWRASLRGGPDTLSASTSTIPVYTDTLTLFLTSSTVDSILLIPSAYVVKDTFGMSITLTGVLMNSTLGMVSQQTMVRFTDTTDAGVAAGGFFQPALAYSDTTKVTTTYFPALLPAGNTTGAYITITARGYDNKGNPAGPPGKTRIFISP